jgi:hypothetical protein
LVSSEVCKFFAEFSETLIVKTVLII